MAIEPEPVTPEIQAEQQPAATEAPPPEVGERAERAERGGRGGRGGGRGGRDPRGRGGRGRGRDRGFDDDRGGFEDTLVKLYRCATVV